jgi:hypothetical protein
MTRWQIRAMSEGDYEIYGIFPAYFGAIEYGQDRDSGAWKEGRNINNSSVGAVLAGLEEMRQHHAAAACAAAADLAYLEQLTAKRHDRLDRTLPFESPPERLVDSALLFLIHPLNVVRKRMMEGAILNLVQAQLKGEIGIKRYAGDSYFCQDSAQSFIS